MFILGVIISKVIKELEATSKILIINVHMKIVMSFELFCYSNFPLIYKAIASLNSLNLNSSNQDKEKQKE